MVFPSRAGNLVSGQTDTNGGNDLFLYDRDTGTVTLVTRAAGSASTTASAPTSLNYWLPALSADGRYFAYVSAATNLVAGQADTNGGEDVFLFDRVADTTTLLSRKSGTLATTGNAGCSSPAISDDGRYVAFSCWATDLFLTSGTPALFGLHGVCGIPGTARAVALNVTVVQGSGPGSLTLYPGDADIPFASAASFNTGATRANNAILPLAYDGSGTLAVLPSVAGGGTVHVILDVVGWFE